MELNKEQLLKVHGGGFNLGIAVSLGALISFLVGVVDGYLRPLKCNK